MTEKISWQNNQCQNIQRRKMIVLTRLYNVRILTLLIVALTSSSQFSPPLAQTLGRVIEPQTQDNHLSISG
jgi:hypothetical protein